MNETCTWQIDGDDDATTSYGTSCGQLFDFYEGGPTENGFKFCPYCGKSLEEIKTI